MSVIYLRVNALAGVNTSAEIKMKSKTKISKQLERKKNPLIVQTIIEAKKNEFSAIVDHYKKELTTLRTGRATPTLVEHVMVEAYGVKTPLTQLAALSVPDPKTLIIQPWDKNIIINIEQGIRNSEIGLQPIVDKETLRVILPELTSERRQRFLKILKEKTEKSRVDVKLQREEIWRDIQLHEKNGDLSEDDKFRSKDELQKIIEKTNDEFGEISAKKEKEITDF